MFDDEQDDIHVEATGTEPTTDPADEINIEVTDSEEAAHRATSQSRRR